MNWFDNDLYKFTMMQAVWEKFPNTRVKYKFYWRNRDNKNFSMIDSKYFKTIIEEFFQHEINSYIMHNDTINYLRKLEWFKDVFLDFLTNFYPTIDNFYIDENNFSFIYEGTWINTILLEVPILSYVSEKIMTITNKIRNDKLVNTLDKELSILKENNIKFADFGTRRRYSKSFHEIILNRYRDLLTGTSNVFYAHKFGLKPIGTMAHEWIMAHQVLAPIHKFEKVALENWADVYRGDLGIALTDTISLKHFLSNTFDAYLAKLFDGVRLDTNCCRQTIKMVVDRYIELGIDPSTKHIVLSDGLKFWELKEYEKIAKEFGINISYGIGTNFTNPSNIKTDIVIKLVEVEGYPTIKISDNPHKVICENEYYRKYMQSVYGIGGKSVIV